jgi:CRISPR/Cas system CMR-associated protein Cmr1 (group 7 of RAMP superfamily)
LRRAVRYKITVVSERYTASIITAMNGNGADDEIVLITEVSTSETSVNFYQTARRKISEDSHL